MKKTTTNSRILHVYVVLCMLFLAIIGYLSYFELHGKDTLMANSYNRRLKAYEQGIIRGTILDRDGIVLATTKVKNEIKTRVYPYKKLYSHVIGYNNDLLGKTLLEAQYNDTLLGTNALGTIGNIMSLITGTPKTGNNLILTIDHDLQVRARELIGDKRGAIVAINPKTGEILAMVSTPDYNPNESALIENWDALTQNENSPLLPRAIFGLYPPGSTFKVVTAVAGIKEGFREYQVDDKGSIDIGGKTFTNARNKAYGPLDMTTAMAVSSNIYFVRLSEELGDKALIRVAEKSGINKKLVFDLPTNKSRISPSISSEIELAATVIGQGKLLVTPLQMALISAGIANDGVIMTPYLVKSVSNHNGQVLTTTFAKKLYRFTDKKTANLVKEMMVESVKSGTGKNAGISDIVVAGKTGTAQNEKSSKGGDDHAWFIGFAPADDPEIAIAVILENQAEDGGQVAAPIARKLIRLKLEAEK